MRALSKGPECRLYFILNLISILILIRFRVCSFCFCFDYILIRCGFLIQFRFDFDFPDTMHGGLGQDRFLMFGRLGQVRFLMSGCRAQGLKTRYFFDVWWPRASSMFDVWALRARLILMSGGVIQGRFLMSWRLGQG